VANEILAGLEAWKSSDRWQAQIGIFNADNFLRQEIYRTPPPVSRKPSGDDDGAAASDFERRYYEQHSSKPKSGIPSM
jgi:hypothetical protein